MTDTVAPPAPTRPTRYSRGGDRMAEDPRLADRRAAVEAHARRRRRRVAAAVVALTVLVAGSVLVTRTSLVDVDRVAVAGNSRVTSARIVQASGVSTGDALLDVDAAAARRRVMALPGIASARVAVMWPNRVRIGVTEEQILVRVVVADGTYEVARGGRVMDRGGAGGGTPTLRTDALGVATLGPGRPLPQVLADAVIVFEQMPDPLRAKLVEASILADGSLEFTLPGNGGTVRFGPPEDVPAKLLAAATMLGGQVVTDCLRVLDLREPTRPTISRTPGCALAPPTVGPTTTSVPKGSARVTTTVPPRTTRPVGR